jgi:hypothetical protein
VIVDFYRGGSPIRVAVLNQAGAGVDHEDALAGVGILLVEHDDASISCTSYERTKRGFVTPCPLVLDESAA